MRDGHTRKLEATSTDDSFEEFNRCHQGSLVILSGGAEGTELLLDKPQLTLGRGPGVDERFDDESMSREHASVEFVAGGHRVRDLGSMNGTHLNGSDVRAAELKHGDRIRIGKYTFQYVVEARENAGPTYVLQDD